MKAKEVASDLGKFVGGAAVIIGLRLLILAWISGAAWVSSKLLPWFQRLAEFFLLSFVVWLPLFLLSLGLSPRSSIRKAIRSIFGTGLVVSSYVFGALLWLQSLLLTLSLWGIWAVLLGLVILGAG